jgi:hypothetical protein
MTTLNFLTSVTNPFRRVLVIPQSLSQGDLLAQAAQSHVQVVRYEDSHSLAALLVQLQGVVGEEPVASIGFAVHGREAGQLALVEDQVLSAMEMADKAQQAFWTGIGQLLQANGRIDLLSCDTAAGKAGHQLLDTIQALSGKAVAGSVDRTGSALQGGNWQLEEGEVDALATYFVAERLGGLTMTLCALNFGAQQVISTAAQAASSVYATDVDGDGDTDVLSASSNDDKIAWYENDGASPPSFTARTISTTADQAFSVYATDVDGDGDTDVLSASQQDDKIAWYENDGASPPGFTARTISTTADFATSVYATDVDGDGDTDVLSASQADNKVAWYENDGASPPGFTARTISTAAITPFSVYATDVDGDGDTDVLSASRSDNKIAWYENDGASPPGFTERVITTAAMNARSVYATDVDGDGDTDVLSASSSDNKVAWYENDGASPPGFTERVITTATAAPYSVYATDVDSDGDTDVLSAHAIGIGTIAWYENDGASPPGFTARTISTATNIAVSVYATDVDGDGDTDVLSASQGDNKVAWYENLGCPSLTPSVTATSTITPTVTPTLTSTPTVTPSGTSTVSASATPTVTSTVTATMTPSVTPSMTATKSTTASVSLTASATATASVTATVTPSRSLSASFSRSVPAIPSMTMPPLQPSFGSSSTTGRRGTTGHRSTTGSQATTGRKGTTGQAEDKSAAIRPLSSIPDITSTAMLIPVMAKLTENIAASTTNVVSTAWEMGKRWWYGEEATSPVSVQEAKQAQAKFAILAKDIEDKLKQSNLESWYQYGLEDLLDDMKTTQSSQLTAKQVKSWQKELIALKADFEVADEVNDAQIKICRNSFFKPQPQPVIPEKQAVLPQPQAQQRITA